MIVWRAVEDLGVWFVREYCDDARCPVSGRPVAICGDSETMARRIAKLPKLEAAVAKMSRCRCWQCDHEAYYLTPTSLCEECFSTDMRRIWTADGPGGKGATP